MSDVVLFGPPLVLGAIFWGIMWFTVRNSRIRRERRHNQGIAE